MTLTPTPRTDLAGLEHDGSTWFLDVVPSIANPWGAIYGGAALGAAVDVAAVEADAPVRWATVRFLVAPTIGQRLTLTYSSDAVGRRTSHATVTAMCDDTTCFEVVLVAGDGDTKKTALRGQWLSMPNVPAPEDCPPLRYGRRADGYAMARTERRIAMGPHPWVDTTSGPGRVGTWVRITEGGTSSPAGLAWLADCVATGVSQAVGPLSRATSLDNTIRYANEIDSDWVLVDAFAEGAADGYAYGRVDLYSESGVLLGTGSQTCLTRRDEDGFPGM